MLQRRVGKLRHEFQQTMLINQTSFDSEYFRLDSMPETLTSGKNMFKIYGNSSLLEGQSTILIQVTDVNGLPIYHHVNNYVDNSGRIVVGIWVYPETPPGLGKIEIIGIARRRPDGRSIPVGFRNRHNVKWSKELVVQPDSLNKTPIIFQQIPGVKIFENEREYLTQTYLVGSSIATQTEGTISYTYSGFGQATITIQNANFSASMAGGLLTVEEPSFNLPGNLSLIDPPDAGNLPTYQSYISQVINSTTVKADPYVLAVNSQVSPVDGLASSGRNISLSTAQTAYPVTSFGSSNYSIEFQQDALLESGSANSQSFASITLKNISPIAGAVHKIKTYMKSAGFADFDLVSTQLLQERDLLIDVNSSLAFDRIGDYKSQEIIDNFWEGETINQAGLTPHLKHDDSIMVSSLFITGSDQLNEQTDYPNDPLPSDPYFKVYSKPDIEIYKDNEYQLKFRVACEAHDGQEKSSLMDVYVSGSTLGNTDERKIGRKLVSLETDNVAPTLINSVGQFLHISQLAASPAAPIAAPSINRPIAQTSLIPAGFGSNTIQEVNPTELPFPDERLLELTFTPTFDSDVHVVFAVTRGKWYISDVSIEGASDFGFTPNHTFFEIPIQTPQADDVLDFKFEFYNSVDEIANISLTTQSLDFVGSNLFISGNNNVLSGSVTIGGGIVMQGFRAS